jgi:purine nucleosidase
MMNMHTKRVIIDTDPGIDDALAILLALASPELEVVALTVVSGNCAMEQGVKNALGILELVGTESIPVARGVPLPLVQPLLLAPETHGETGLGYARLDEPEHKPSQQHAVDLIISETLNSPGEISLVTLGPLTNLALAVRREPNIVPAIGEVIIMGGAIRHGGNTTPLAEFNIFCDPHAAHIIFHSGLPITLVPLDVTYQVLLTREDVDDLLKVRSPVTRFIDQATRYYMEFHSEYQGLEGCVINDPLALALAFAPDLVDVETHFVDVDISEGVSLGKTFADFYGLTGKEANMNVALEVRSREFIELFLERISELAVNFPQ